MTKVTLVLFALAGCNSMQTEQSGTQYAISRLLFEDNFDRPVSSAWVVESEESLKLGGLIRNGNLDVDVSKGITIWNTKKFPGNAMYEYRITAVETGGKNDRVSDLNCFWMATDPLHPDDFFARSSWRGGVFHHYYTLSLYYVGYGGHDNSRTRFRRYNGEAAPPPIIKEYTDSAHLIEPDKGNVVRIVCLNGLIKYYFNEKLLFELKDENADHGGYFGFRTTNNHMRIHDFKVYSIESR